MKLCAMLLLVTMQINTSATVKRLESAFHTRKGKQKLHRPRQGGRVRGWEMMRRLPFGRVLGTLVRCLDGSAPKHHNLHRLSTTP